ncbi:acyltransferase [Gemmatimonadota bacterium]
MKQLQISQTDVLFANGNHPIEFLLFFPEAPDTESIRKALRRLSPAWWPFFGSYEAGLICFDRYQEELCFDEESRDHDFTIPRSHTERFEVCQHYTQPGSARLFSLKIIRFRHGAIIIPRLSHLAGDGYSYFTFLAILAAMSRKSLIPLKAVFLNRLLKPHHNRTIMKKFRFSDEYLPSAPQHSDNRVECEEIPVREVASIVKGLRDPDVERISTNDVLSALVLKKIVGSHRESWGDLANLFIPIDVRHRIPEYGRRFIGNALQLHTASLESDMIVNTDIAGIARSIRASMPDISRESYLSYLSELEELIGNRHPDAYRPFDPERGCLVTNLTRMPTDRLDFGSGPPALLHPLTTGTHAAAIMKDEDRYVLQVAH